MQQFRNEYKTMYIKFPTVTKLTYPTNNYPDSTESQAKPMITFRHNFMKMHYNKLDIIKTAEEFKIIKLPAKSDIMNICSMPVHSKEEENQGESSGRQDGVLRNRIFSIGKLNTINNNKAQQDKAFKNPFKVKQRSNSLQELKKLNSIKNITFDYFQIYPQVAKLIALSFGVQVVNSAGHRIRRGRVQDGNNGFLVKQVLKRRNWWNVLTEDQLKNQKKDEEYKLNLIWTSHIVNKNLIDSLANNNESQMAHMLELEDTPVFQRSFPNILRQIPKISQLFFTEWQEKPKNMADWIKNLTTQNKIRKLYPDQLIIHNHMPKNYEITNKKLLYKNIVNFYRQIDVNPFTKIPKTYHITCLNWQEAIKDLRGFENIWILKPGEFTNRGKGIRVFRNTKEIIDYILIHPPKTQERSYILQEYIRPMLYEQRKFDIRCFMLGLQVGQCLKFFWYEEGYIRTASQKFSTKKVDRSIHLTNDAIQKHMRNYDKYESANKLSYIDINKYFANNTPYKFYEEILPEIKSMARDVCSSVADKNLIGNGRGVNFQIFGLDFLIDEVGKPWLCEVNTNPSLQICCTLLSRIIPELLQNTFRLVLDILQPPAKKNPEYAQNFITNNKFSLIYNRRSL